jgi:predicted phosphohydrolase
MLLGRDEIMSLFAIADLHLSLSSGKPMDVFTGWEDYLVKLDKNWHNIVFENDTVVLPGDISWAMSLDEAVMDLKYLNALPGRKIILKGNHDYWWTTVRRMNAFIAENSLDSISVLHNTAVTVGGVCVCGTRGWFYDDTEAADKKVLMREAGRLETSIAEGEKTGLETVVFLHYPPIYNGSICIEIMDVLVRHKIKRCYYGHLHGRATAFAFEGLYEGICFKLISADYLRFSPLAID